MKLAALLCCCACLPNPRGQCASDADCAGGSPGAFCAEGICQGAPQAVLLTAPGVHARSDVLQVQVKVTRSHGAPSVRALFAESSFAAAEEAPGVFTARVPLQGAPRGVEGPVAYTVEVRDDLGHATVVPTEVVVDDLAPRIAVDPATIPPAPVVRGTQVRLRFTVTDLGPVTVPLATQNPDGSYLLLADTGAAPAAATSFAVPITATDAVGNQATVHAAVPVTRLKYFAVPPANQTVQSLVLNDGSIWALTGQSNIWLINRSNGAQLFEAPAGATVFPQLATDGLELFFSRTDNQVCRMAADGTLRACCGPYATLGGGPILSSETAFVATSGSTATGQRLYAILDTGTASCQGVGSTQLGNFALTAPGIGPQGDLFAGAAQAVVAAQFDGIGWNARVTAEAPQYLGSPAFRGAEVLLSTSASTLDAFTFGDPISSPAPAPSSSTVAALGTRISAPTIAADGTAVFATEDQHVVALSSSGALRWSALLPDPITAPPTQGAGDLIYAGTSGGQIYALSLADGSTVWSYTAGAPIRGPLAPGCDGVLYAALDGGVLALVIDAAGLAGSLWPSAAHDVHGSGDARRPLRSATSGCLE